MCHEQHPRPRYSSDRMRCGVMQASRSSGDSRKVRRLGRIRLLRSIFAARANTLAFICSNLDRA